MKMVGKIIKTFFLTVVLFCFEDKERKNTDTKWNVYRKLISLL